MNSSTSIINLHQRITWVVGSLLMAGILLPALLWMLSGSASSVAAAPTTSTAELRVCPDGPPTCDYASVQAAVDTAQSGDVIKVATGVYTDIHAREGITQVVYVSKTVTVRGGYTTADWDNPDPEANPVTLYAQGQGRVVYITGAISPTLEGLRLTGGDATGLGSYYSGHDAGGGVYISQATTTISNCQIVSNIASTISPGRGGGVYLLSSTSELVNNTIKSNVASISSGGSGGGLFLENESDVMLNYNTIMSNTASTASSGSGGGLSLGYGSDATMQGNKVTGNVASTASSGSGGGIFFYSENTATLQSNELSDNIASTAGIGKGGALFATESDLNLQSNEFSDNIASMGETGYGNGGGVYLDDSIAVLHFNLIQNNLASEFTYGAGGGLYMRGGDGRITLESNLVSGNTASVADAAHGGGLYFTEVDDIVFSGNTVQGNIASSAAFGAGGGLYVDLSTGTFIGNTIVGNTATLEPTSNGNGGGIAVGLSSPFSFTNNVIAGNRANTYGSGLWFEGSSYFACSGSLLHNTISDNLGNGQGVFVGEYTTLSFTNTIISGHSSMGIHITTGGDAGLEGTLWHSNGVDTGGDGTIMLGTVNIYGDPDFIDPATWDYHLGTDSAAIDAGVDAGVVTDIDGDARPWGLGYDIGADEYLSKPIANAGASQAVYSGTVTLDGSGSYHPNGDPLIYNWEQTGGTPVILSDSTAISTTFEAPTSVGLLTFKLTVTDSFGASDFAMTTVMVYSDRIFLPIILK